MLAGQVHEVGHVGVDAHLLVEVLVFSEDGLARCVLEAGRALVLGGDVEQADVGGVEVAARSLGQEAVAGIVAGPTSGLFWLVMK